MNTSNVSPVSAPRRNYRPLIELGQGGMARVYLAESLASGVRKLVVLKILNRELARDASMRTAFRREAELSAQLNHPNVVQVFEVVEHSGAPVIVMEYLDGVSLALVLKEAQHELPLALQLHILTQVLAGLHHFHELRDFDGKPLNAVHRDVSPHNVLVLYEGPVKVVDFGIAKVHGAGHHTRSGTIKGKLHYMPPEQLLGDSNVDRRADVFAVGVMLWEAVAARRMWHGRTEPQVVRALACGELPRLRDAVPNVPSELERIVERATHADREERYATAEEMQLDLEHALQAFGRSVQIRELSNFMVARFGERRVFQRRAVERALRDPVTTLSAVMECVSPLPLETGLGFSSESGQRALADVEGESREGTPASGTSASLSHGSAAAAAFGDFSGANRGSTLQSVAPNARAPASRRWRSRAVAGALVIAAAAAAVWLAVRPNGETRPAPAAAARSVVLDVTVDPETAQILLDGRELGRGRYRGSHGASDRDAVLEARAPGYVTDRRVVRMTRDFAAALTLSAETPAASGEAHATAEHAKAEARPSRRTDTKAAPPRRASAATRPAKRAAAPAEGNTAGEPTRAAAANCDPPFRLTPDGVQVFKPECL